MKFELVSCRRGFDRYEVSGAGDIVELKVPFEVQPGENVHLVNKWGNVQKFPWEGTIENTMKSFLATLKAEKEIESSRAPGM